MPAPPMEAPKAVASVCQTTEEPCRSCQVLVAVCLASISLSTRLELIARGV